VPASSEDDRTTSLQPHITSDTIISAGSILKHAALIHFIGQLHAKLATCHGGYISDRIYCSSPDLHAFIFKVIFKSYFYLTISNA
jgi:hypothetical protein